MRASPVLLLVALSLVAPLPARAAADAPHASVDAVLDALNATVRFKQVALSPDGTRVAWVETVPTKDGPRPDATEVYVLELGREGAAPRRLSAAHAGAHADEHDLAWSPDGQRLAFLSDAAKKEQAQLYVADAASLAVRPVTQLSGRPAAVAWSPDGQALTFLLIEGTLEEKGPTGAASRQVGVVDEKPVSQRLVRVALAGGAPTALTPDGLFVYEYTWSPKGDALALVAAPPPGDANWWTAALYTVGAQGGAAPRKVHAPRLQIAEPRFSPDGTRLAFIEGLMSDQGSVGGDVYAVPAEGGKAENLTPGLRASASDLAWVAPGKLVVFANLMGESAVGELVPGTRKVEWKWHGPERVSAGGNISLSLAHGGTQGACVREDFTRAPEVYVGELGHWRPLTRRNARLEVPRVGAAHDVRWSSDGLRVQGWLLTPAGEPKGAPMVTVVHGGPAAGVVPSFRPDALLLAARGYAVFMPNPRGSFGQGEAFTEANRRDFGYGDLRDVLRGVDQVVARHGVDPDRLGVTGWSYGGYMTMWAVTQTPRFRAAVAGAGIANWQSYYGTNRIDTWMLPFFGKSVYEDPRAYARSSPMTFITRVKTPTLVLHGERDAEVPASQGFEFWKALKTLGVPTQLVVYPDEGHGLRKPEHQRDRYRRSIDWFDRLLAPRPAAAPTASPAR